MIYFGGERAAGSGTVVLFIFLNEVQPSSILHDNSPRMHRVNRLLYSVLQQV